MTGERGRTDKALGHRLRRMRNESMNPVAQYDQAASGPKPNVAKVLCADSSSDG